MHSHKKVLSVFSLVMINVIAVDSLRTLPITAKLGLSLVTYYCLAAIVFFIPVALVAAELATTYPHTGGIYIWVREAFGKRIGFVTIWLQWIYNVVWYPTILAFISSTIAYLFDPSFANNRTFLLLVIVSLFWIFTFVNFFGMKVSSIISTIGALFGTLLPMLLIIVLGIVWIFQGRPIVIGYDSSWFPDLSSFGNLSLFSAVLFGLLGMEMSAVHADEVQNPKRDYPKALFYSTILIFSSLMFGSLAIVMVIPNQSLSVVSGLIDAYAIFFKAYNLPWLTTLIALLIIMGGLSGVSAWIIGPTKGLLIAAEDKCLPSSFAKVNRFGAPVQLLLLQGIIFTLLSTVFLFSDSINAAYWILSASCSQMALLVYVFMFAAAIRLRYVDKDKKRPYQIPGGNFGMWVVAGTGLLCCIITTFIGFIPPSQIAINNILFFETFLVGTLVVFMVIPWLISKNNEGRHSC